MSIFKERRESATLSLSRDNDIAQLETKREELNKEIERLLVSYKKLTGDKSAVKGAKKIGKAKKDYGYWHK